MPGRAKLQLSSVAAALLHHRDLAAQMLRLGGPQRVRRPGLDRSQQPSAASSAPASRFALAAASRRCARRAGCGVSIAARSRERGRRGQSPAHLRQAGRALQFLRDGPRRAPGRLNPEISARLYRSGCTV